MGKRCKPTILHLPSPTIFYTVLIFSQKPLATAICCGYRITPTWRILAKNAGLNILPGGLPPRTRYNLWPESHSRHR